MLSARESAYLLDRENEWCYSVLVHPKVGKLEIDTMQ